MIAVDTDLRVCAHRREARLGDAAHAVMTELAEGDRSRDFSLFPELRTRDPFQRAR